MKTLALYFTTLFFLLINLIWFDLIWFLFYLNRGGEGEAEGDLMEGGVLVEAIMRFVLTYQSLIISWWCLYSTLGNKVKFADWTSIFFSRELWRRSVELFHLTIEALLVMIRRQHQKKIQFCRPTSIQYNFNLNRIIKSLKKREDKICTCSLLIQNFKFGNMLSPFICSHSMYVDSCYLT